MRAAVIIQARVGSQRFPGKVLAGIQGRPMLAWVIERARAIPGIDVVVLAIPRGADDDVLLWWAGKLDVVPYRGDPIDLLARYDGAARAVKAEVVVRVTADCPFLDPELAGAVLAPILRGESVFASNCWPLRTYPDGLDVEAFTADFLQSASVGATDSDDREHVTGWMRRAIGREALAELEPARKAHWIAQREDLGAVRWTVDTREDLEKVRLIAAHLPEGSYAMADTRKAAEAARVWP